MNVELITLEDLQQFKTELIHELMQVLNQPTQQAKQWLKSAEVRKLLNISPGTLQNLRINGTLRFTKIGGIMFYKAADIYKMLEGDDAG
ncbi:helix-turn-helix domain-containing protein [Hufsiella ginkgonis]|uniref:Helix-turn-helix domain-containing protein n=1 Tax=Hufsiella ginkgonis TaxID=2695274 RepID=A0A7K1Y1H9_9SPHI|nr:helix-turn-helix domain-containing protein [Hufsiella ginkgonis]MXV16536.1 helix-turn-helix domain-containing protein [Hufsiella ginkgonis]